MENIIGAEVPEGRSFIPTGGIFQEHLIFPMNCRAQSYYPKPRFR
jgi:hypothetical protein